MAFRFPLHDVKIIGTNIKKTIQEPAYNTYYARLNQNEFLLDVKETACFYASNGNYIEVVAHPAADLNTLELYLNGSVYGAILHQRKIIPLHGSCFLYRGKGVMICGESGAGKSSLTAAFCIDGAEFLTDDITPILFEDDNPHIWAMSDRIKLWDDSLLALNQTKEDLIQVMPEREKFYFPMESRKGANIPLDYIFVLDIQETPGILMRELHGIDKFVALCNEVYRREYLRGMPESEATYVEQLISVSRTIPITKVSRHTQSSIGEVKDQLERYIAQLETVIDG